ncbi:MAG: PEP/pyruvate-binding domain-containing protein, partial [Bacillota bacterium]
MKIVWLHDPAARDPQLVGSKAASLSALMARYPVPPGFCLTADGPLEGETLPAAAAAGLQVAYTQLGRRAGSPAPVVAVRPSRLEEDGPAPEPGGAVLHVSGLEALTAAVQQCLSANEGQRAVIVQQFIPADLSGIACSINPTTGSRSEMQIHATWGLGGGRPDDPAGADRYRISRPGLALLESRVGEKRRMTVPVAGGTAEVDVPRLLRGEPTLNGERVEEIARVLLALEAEWKRPVAVAFAYEGEQLYLLQCGPAQRPEGPAEPVAAQAAAAGPAESGLVVEVPPEFPVAWPHPEDAQRYWIHDPTLNPDQVLPLFASFCEPWATAWVRENPQIGCEFRRINTYLYERYFPNPDGPLVEEQPVWAAAQLQSLWQREILPEVQSQCLHLANTDLAAVPRHALRSQLEEVVDRYILIWELHWRIINPVQATLERYREIYGELFAPADPLEDLVLLQGFDNKLMEANRELWRLSREIPDNPHLRALFAERPAGEILAALPHTPAGEAWLEQFRAYLERFGRRFELWDWSRPSWREEPTPVIQAVQALLAAPAYQPVEGASRRAAERERAEEGARERLAGYPRPVRERFESCLRAAQIAAVLKEEHDFWIDHWSMYEVRR